MRTAAILTHSNHVHRTGWLALFVCALFFLIRGVLAPDPAGRTPRTVALTCCERSEEAWTILNAWQRSCANAATRDALTTKKFAAMLSLQSRSPIPATVASAVCEDAALSSGAITAYMRHALCTSLPRNHADLARSVYSALMDEAPELEDELTGDMEAACRDLQSRWIAEVRAWTRQLRTETVLSSAQTALCRSACRWKNDDFGGPTYDL